MDLDTWGRRCGDLVEDPSEVTEVVARSLSDPGRHAEIRHAMAEDLFFNPGHATDRAMDWFHREFAPSPCGASS